MLQNSNSAENFSDKFSSSNRGQTSGQKTTDAKIISALWAWIILDFKELLSHIQ
jgi:hypothetical protein